MSLDEQVERLRRRVEGPPEPRWVTRDARDTALLREALSVVEFGTVMQPVRPALCSARSELFCTPSTSHIRLRCSLTRCMCVLTLRAWPERLLSSCAMRRPSGRQVEV